MFLGSTMVSCFFPCIFCLMILETYLDLWSESNSHQRTRHRLPSSPTSLKPYWNERPTGSAEVLGCPDTAKDISLNMY